MMADWYLLCVLSQSTSEFLVSLTGRIPEMSLKEKIAKEKNMLSLNSNCGFCEIFRTEEKHGRRPTGTRPFSWAVHTWQGLFC